MGLCTFDYKHENCKLIVLDQLNSNLQTNDDFKLKSGLHGLYENISVF